MHDHVFVTFCIIMQNLLFSNIDDIKSLYMYEGCPSKSWTFVIKRDCVSGMLRNLQDVFIYI